MLVTFLLVGEMFRRNRDGEKVFSEEKNSRFSVIHRLKPVVSVEDGAPVGGT